MEARSSRSANKTSLLSLTSEGVTNVKSTRRQNQCIDHGTALDFNSSRTTQVQNVLSWLLTHSHQSLKHLMEHQVTERKIS